MTDGWGGDLLRWGLGGTLVLGLHLGAGYWLVHAAGRGEVAGLPDAIMIDLAPAPAPAPEPGPAESPTPEASDPVPESEPAPEAEPEPEPEAESVPETEAEPAPDFRPPDFQELPPVEDFSDLIPEPLPVPDFEPPPLTELPPITNFSQLLPDSALLLSASARPAARSERRAPDPQPARQEPRQETQRRETPRQPEQARQAPQSQPSPQRQQAQPSQRQREAGGGGQRQGNPAATAQQQADWRSRVQSRIMAQMSKRRLRGSGRSGVLTVTVRVSIAASGATSARLGSSTGDSGIDATLAGLAARMPNMPPPPTGQAVSFDLPIQVRVN